MPRRIYPLMHLLGRRSLALAAAAAAAALAAASSCALPPGEGDHVQQGQTALRYRNPLRDVNTPDPGVVRAGPPDAPIYYLAHTGADPGGYYPVLRSSNLVTWEPAGHLLPSTQRTWVTGNPWAPEIHPFGDRFVAVYTGNDDANHLSIGVATAPDPLGPWTERADADGQPTPAIRSLQWGNLDASVFQEDGKVYIVWKEGTTATPIYLQQMTTDALSLDPDAQRVTLITNDLADEWEGNLVEAPWIIRHDDRYYLFYSANAWFDARYAVGVARSPTLLAPRWEKPADKKPILRSNDAWKGPGHGSIVHVRDDDYFLYHAFAAGRVGGDHPRMLLMDKISWQDGWPRINDGTPSTGDNEVP